MFNRGMCQVFLRAKNAAEVLTRGKGVWRGKTDSAAARAAKAKDKRVKITWCEREAELVGRMYRGGWDLPPTRIVLRTEICPPKSVCVPPKEPVKISLWKRLRKVLPGILFWLSLLYLTHKMGIWSYTYAASDYITTGLMSLYLEMKGLRSRGAPQLPNFAKLVSYLFLIWNEVVKIAFYPFAWLAGRYKCRVQMPINYGFGGESDEPEIEIETLEEWLVRIVEGVDAFTEFTEPELSYRTAEELDLIGFEKREGMRPPVFEQLVDPDIAFAHMPELEIGGKCHQYRGEELGEAHAWMEVPTCPENQEECEEKRKKASCWGRSSDEEVIRCEDEDDPCVCKTIRRRRFDPSDWCLCPFSNEGKKEDKEEKEEKVDVCAEKRKEKQEEKERKKAAEEREKKEAAKVAKEKKDKAREEKEKEKKKAEEEKEKVRKAKEAERRKSLSKEERTREDKAEKAKQDVKKAADKARQEKEKAVAKAREDKEKATAKAREEKEKAAAKARAEKEKAEKKAEAEMSKAEKKAEADKKKSEKEEGEKKKEKEELPPCPGSKFAREIRRKSLAIEERRRKREEEEEAREFARRCRQ